MPATTRKKSASTRVSLASSSAAASSPAVATPTPTPNPDIRYKDDDPFNQEFNNPEDLVSDHDSDHSEYGNTTKKSKKRKKVESEDENPFKRRRGRAPPTPELPDLSDDECVRDRDEPVDEEQEIRDQFTTPNELPKNLVLRVSADGKTFVDLNLANLLKSNSTLLPMDHAQTPKSIQDVEMAQDKMLVDGDHSLTSTKRKGFFDLPSEIRIRIYRLTFRGQAAVDFSSRVDFARSAHFLRTSKQVYREGAQILYGENSFHFGRCHERRGAFWDPNWKEVGFKDARRFLEMIGPHNIASLKYVSFSLEDGSKYNFPHWRDATRKRYVEDPVLQHVFRLIGTNATLQKLAVCFGGRANVKQNDFHFLKSFTEMRCRQLIVYNGFRGARNKIDMPLKSKLKKVMELPYDQDHELAIAENNKNKVKMAYEGSHGTWYITFL